MRELAELWHAALDRAGRARRRAERRRSHPVRRSAGVRDAGRHRGARTALPDADRRVAAVAAAVRTALPRPARRATRWTSTPRRWCSTSRAIVDTGRLRGAGAGVDRPAREPAHRVRRPTIRRTAVQVVVDHVALPWEELDLSGAVDEAEREERMSSGLSERPFGAVRHGRPPLIRFLLIRTGRERLPVVHHQPPHPARRLVDAAADEGSAGAVRDPRRRLGAAARAWLPRLTSAGCPNATPTPRAAPGRTHWRDWTVRPCWPRHRAAQTVPSPPSSRCTSARR